ncbi:hypothetical protein Taro_017068 [Colocasia esculenta]|uniref:Uncharacterized protein n=1 Tax=Colocasia esculenta TaxID=4460 RepID=A0A843UQ81_COLES|nr:hypothetical protein [Colocasia esculenta]
MPRRSLRKANKANLKKKKYARQDSDEESRNRLRTKPWSSSPIKLTRRVDLVERVHVTSLK